MSKRASEMMREDMEALGAVKIRDVEAAQKELLQLARSLEQEGVLRLSTTETEQYVV
jgi:flagellar motor switch protein FliG